MGYGFFDPTIVLMIPAIIFTLIAQARVKSAYARYSKVPARRGLTGGQVARMILDSNGMKHVPIQVISGELTDNYDPTKDVMHLSQGVCNGTSIASISVAAHESGHAIQDGVNYGFLKFRVSMVPLVNFVSGLSWPVIIVGILVGAAGQTFGNLIFDIGILMFVVVVLFHAVTLPVELNASSRAIGQLQSLGIIQADEVKGAKAVLSAAALTYVAALASSILTLLRILLLRSRD